jgi:hypothetical protein
MKSDQKSAYAPLTVWHRWKRSRQLSRCVQEAYAVFADRHPVCVDSLFDHWFLFHGARPLLERYLTGPTPPTAKELATAWQQQFGGPNDNWERRIAKMTPISAEFLSLVEEELTK